MRDQVPRVVCLQPIHVRAVAVNLFSNAVTSAVKKVFPVTRSLDHTASRFIHLPPLQWLPCCHVLANQFESLVARLANDGENLCIFLRRRRAEVPHPAYVALAAAR